MKLSIYLKTGAALAFASVAMPSFAQFEVHNLVSDGFVPAGQIDGNLVNPWGVAHSPTGPFWVANNGTGTSTVYDGQGNPFPASNPIVVATVASEQLSPTGIVFNGGPGFVISSSLGSGPSKFIFAIEEGLIAAWNPVVDPDSAVIVADRSAMHAKYKGLAIVNLGEHSFIYATNFASGNIDVFNDRFQFVGQFTDRRMMRGYAPFGIQAFGNRLVVTFAIRGANGDDVAGQGHGFVDVFAPNGTVVRRLVAHGRLNSPWGLAIAPSSFGRLAGSLLVGNFGDGRINAYSRFDGHYMGTLKQDGHPIEIEGLWSLIPGNGGDGGDPDDIYFSAGPGEEQHGIFGEIAALKS